MSGHLPEQRLVLGGRPDEFERATLQPQIVLKPIEKPRTDRVEPDDPGEVHDDAVRLVGVAEKTGQAGLNLASLISRPRPRQRTFKGAALPAS